MTMVVMCKITIIHNFDCNENVYTFSEQINSAFLFSVHAPKIESDVKNMISEGTQD